mmetsp:Transcript_20709/g.30430  ORF Transcript_20709/g.30430 Transcript_20709/m.30430 type:complete len:110 (-) Transcript_20709:6-335(-)
MPFSWFCVEFYCNIVLELNVSRNFFCPSMVRQVHPIVVSRDFVVYDAVLYEHTLGSELSKSLAISSSDGRPPVVTSDASVNVQYDSLLFVGGGMVARIFNLIDGSCTKP